MSLSVVLFLGVFLLCGTGGADRACQRLRLRIGTVAALSLLLAALSGVSWQLSKGISLHPATLLSVIAAAVPLRNRAFPLFAALAALACGALGWVLTLLFPTFFEPALLAALPALLVAGLLTADRPMGLLVILLSPLFTGLMTTLSDWYLFDTALLNIGSGLQLDAQAAGAFLYGLLLCLPTKTPWMKRQQENET